MNDRMLRHGESIDLKVFHTSNIERLLTKCFLEIDDNREGYEKLENLITSILKVRFPNKELIHLDTDNDFATVSISLDNILIQASVDTSNHKINECIDKFRDNLLYKTHDTLILVAPYKKDIVNITRLFKENKIYTISIKDFIDYLYPENPFKELNFREMNRIISILNDFLNS